MKVFLISLFMLLSFGIFAQNTDSLGYLSNLNGKGLVLRKGNQMNLKIPFFFLNGDVVRMTSGNALLVLYNEDEIKLISGQSYTVAENKNIKTNRNSLLFNINTKKSATSFIMRSARSSKNIFPRKSKISDPSKAVIYLSPQSKDRYFFKLLADNSREPLFNLNNADSSVIDLSSVPFEEGRIYTWRLKYPEFEQTGTIELMPKEESDQMQKFALNNRASYVSAFNYYCSNGCYFDALEVISAAIKNYPDDEYYQYLRNSIF